LKRIDNKGAMAAQKVGGDHKEIGALVGGQSFSGGKRLNFRRFCFLMTDDLGGVLRYNGLVRITNHYLPVLFLAEI
jgi:hypothetical protein